MRLARTIVALLIAFSVATLPLAGGAAFAAKAGEMSASDVMHEGCDHSSPSKDNSKSVNDCASIAACAAKCFGCAGTALSHLGFVPIQSTPQPVRDGDVVVSQIGNPPFRPPRV
jgi:hypothetical protein